MLKLGMIIILLTASPEGEVWEYNMIQHPVTCEYAFFQGNVYLIDDGVPFLYPQIPFTAYAAYGDGWAAMYFREGLSWAFVVSDFDNYRALQIGVYLYIIYRFDFVLSKVNR